MGEKKPANGEFALKNRQKFTSATYTLYTLTLKKPRPVQDMRKLFYSDNPMVDVCLCYRQNGSKALVHSIQVNERMLEPAEKVLRGPRIAFVSTEQLPT